MDPKITGKGEIKACFEIAGKLYYFLLTQRSEKPKMRINTGSCKQINCIKSDKEAPESDTFDYGQAGDQETILDRIHR